MSVHDFMRDYRKQTVSCNRWERIWQERVAFELRPHYTWVTLGKIRALTPGRGDGSAGLDWLCALADKHRVRLEGIVEPFGDNPPMTEWQLDRFYERHGFTIVDAWPNSYIERKALTVN
jgi:hypothetical protein